MDGKDLTSGINKCTTTCACHRDQTRYDSKTILILFSLLNNLFYERNTILFLSRLLNSVQQGKIKIFNFMKTKVNLKQYFKN